MKNAMFSNDLPIFLFHQGTNFRSYELLGAHFDSQTGRAVFRTWAPDAASVKVVGDFNAWNNDANPMTRISDGGIWETELTGVLQWQRYKYSIIGRNGLHTIKADPFAFHSETNERTASIVYDIDGYEWHDSEWVADAKKNSVLAEPVNIYELHLGSWRKHPDGNAYSYAQIADTLIPYVSEMGYTHIELMPVMEHPYVKSWGYQITGYYAVTSRYGTPHDFMNFVDRCHMAGLGVILDWVPAHFPNDSHGLVAYDCEALFEEHGDGHMELQEWSTHNFDFGRAEVQSFLISNADFWLNVYHADGLRLDSVSSMIYLDYGRAAGQWTPNTYGGNENLDAIAFLRKLNKTILDMSPNTLMIAEESMAWPLVTKPMQDGGLGFNFKWNTGWMSDLLEYAAADHIYRSTLHDKITLSFYSAFSENFILPVSHDEVVHGKASLISKMPGTTEEKFSGLRCFLGYMIMHPGKKLNFMGTEFGQFKEWDDDAELDWFLLDYPQHAQLHSYVRDLNHFYRNNPALWEIDYSWEGFRWISDNNKAQSIIIFMRISKDGDGLVICQNFSPVTRENYAFGVPDPGVYEEVWSSDKLEYGGSGRLNGSVVSSPEPMHGLSQRISVTIPALTTLCFKLSPPTESSLEVTIE